MSVVSEGVMEGRFLADAAINEFSVFGGAEGEHINFLGNEQFGRGVGKLTENGLRPDDNEPISAADSRRGPKNMLKLTSRHAGTRL